MRQIFRLLPWVHARSHERFRDIFLREGRYMQKRKGEAIQNGGLNGDVFWLERGLGGYVTTDHSGRTRILAFILPGRLMGDVDGVTGETVNMFDVFLRPSEGWLLKRSVFREYLEADRTLDRMHFLGILADHEADMEALFASATLELDMRLRVLTAALCFADEPDPLAALTRAIDCGKSYEKGLGRSRARRTCARRARSHSAEALGESLRLDALESVHLSIYQSLESIRESPNAWMPFPVNSLTASPVTGFLY